jgi:hypothetical protein
MNIDVTFPVVIKDFKAEVNKTTGEEFHVLLLEQDGFKPTADGLTSRADEKKCRITSTWSAEKCAAYKGKTIPGHNIVRVECTPYPYEVNGVKTMLSHTWVLQKA